MARTPHLLRAGQRSSGVSAASGRSPFPLYPPPPTPSTPRAGAPPRKQLEKVLDCDALVPPCVPGARRRHVCTEALLGRVTCRARRRDARGPDPPEEGGRAPGAGGARTARSCRLSQLQTQRRVEVGAASGSGWGRPQAGPSRARGCFPRLRFGSKVSRWGFPFRSLVRTESEGFQRVATVQVPGRLERRSCPLRGRQPPLAWGPDT